MAFEFEALVGHLHLVGGRAISIPPPGALVEVTPKKTARGRETDTFFALVLPGGDTAAKPEFFERMAGLACETYFGSTGSMTSGLQSVFKYLNENLYMHNADARRTGQKRFEASLICGVMRGTDLYIGRVGSAVAAIRTGTETTPFPASFEDDEALIGPPLGVHVDPDTQIRKIDLQAGMRILFADPLLADLTIEQVGAALGSEDIAAALSNLKEVCVANGIKTLQAACFEFIAAAQPVSLPVREVVSTAELTAIPPSATATGETPAVNAEVGATHASPLQNPTTQTSTADPAAAKPDSRGNEPRRSAGRKQAMDRTAGGAAMAGAGFLQVIKRVFDLFVPKPKDGSKGWLATPAATGVTILIPIIVVAMVVVLWVTGTGESEYDRCIEQANSTARVARNIASSDVTGTINAWNALITKANECLNLRPNDAEMQALVREARGVIDQLLYIQRREMVVLDTFQRATLTRVVLQGEDLYVLDSGNNQVYRDTLGSDGLSIARRQEAIPAMRINANVLQFTVGPIVDIAWAESGQGLSQSNALTMLDRNGVLVDCSPRFLQDCSAQRLPGTETWNTPLKTVFWNGGLYLLDAAANQIWRYRSTGLAFSNTPTEYFTGSGRPDIRTAIDFDIDSQGTVFIITNDGRMLRFTSGEAEDFAFTFRTGQSMSSVDNMFMSDNPIAQSMYFVSRADRTIYETTFSGTFMQSYRASDEDLFTSLTDVAVDVNRGIVYAVSGNSLFAFQRGT